MLFKSVNVSMGHCIPYEQNKNNEFQILKYDIKLNIPYFICPIGQIHLLLNIII